MALPRGWHVNFVLGVVAVIGSRVRLSLAMGEVAFGRSARRHRSHCC